MTHIHRSTWAALLLLAGLLAAAVPVRAEKAGADVILNETVRHAHPDWPDSVDSSVVRSRKLALWTLQWGEPDALVVRAEREDYVLEGGDGAGLIDLDLLKLHPRLRMKRDLWALDASLLMLLDVQRNAASYQALPGEDRERFFLPALVASLTPRPLLFQGGIWEEYEILPLLDETYALSVARILLVGAGFAFSERAEAWLRAHETRRYYPATFDLSRTDILAEYRLRDPLEAGEHPWWREASVEWALQHYPGTGEAFRKVYLTSVLNFGTAGVTHYVTPRLTWTDSYVVFRRGVGRTLLEQNVRQPDTLLQLGYEGFRVLGEGRFVAAWGVTVEESLHQRVQSTRIAHLKAEWKF